MHVKNYKILVVDDEEEIRNAVVSLLRKEQYVAIGVSNGKEALKILDQSFSLIILDIMMPDKDGISTCIDIREKYFIPVLFLTAKNTEHDKYIGFSVGGDDYLAKPFSRIELLARVASLLRRYHVYQTYDMKNEKEDYIIIKDLKLDKHTARVFKDNQEIVLTNMEYKILQMFVQNPNKIFTLEMIYENVWNEKYDYSVNACIMVHIKNLRKKLGDTPQGAKYIKNIWGRGYCIENENW